MRYYLLPIADRKPLAWIITEQRTAFGNHRAREAEALAEGDVLLLYTTRGCFRNPTRDRGRIIGKARVAAPARRQRKPVVFSGREYPWVVELDIEQLAPARQGVELAPLIPHLARTFPDPKSWSVRMRRALVPIEAVDARSIARKLKPISSAYASALPSYAHIA
jgi:hypothetical protein